MDNPCLKDTVFPIPTIHTERLVLRPCRAEDFDAVNKYAQNPEVCQFIRPAEGEERVRHVIKSLSSGWRFSPDEWSGLMITLPEDDRPIGDLVFRVDDEATKRIEIGYRLSPQYAGRGYITEAVFELIERLFKEFGVHKIVARCDPRNIPSYRIMEKLGMKREAFFKQHYLNGDQLTDQLDYAILSSEWKQVLKSK
jgi:RimJ/RimL family protein N-acetyltransferase